MAKLCVVVSYLELSIKLMLEIERKIVFVYPLESVDVLGERNRKRRKIKYN